jgi:Ca2+-binding RTX toxin-like protein
MFPFKHRTKALGCAAAGALLLAVTAPAQASTQVGAVFAPISPCEPGFTFLQVGTASGPSYTVPSAGVITSWSFRADASPPTLKLKVGRHVSANDYRIIGESGLQLPAPNTLNTFATRIPVLAGDLIGDYLTSSGACGDGFLVGRADGSANVVGYVMGDLGAGTSATFSLVPKLLADISARVEPDADHDGFGDETQDSCFTDPSTHGACAPPTVSGTAQNGRTLSASPQGSPGNPSLQWLRCDSAGNGCASIPGATGGSYKLTSADIAHTMRARKTASNSSGVQQALSAHTATVQPAPGACSNVQAHAAGAGNDTITGTSGGDLISGLAGNDVLSGAAGADCLNGGPGNDKLSGGAGNDRLSGGPGNDVMDGGSGNDKIATGGGKNKVNAGSGNDNVNSANRKRDIVDCGSGRDTVRADNNDKLIGCEVKRLV